MNSMMRCAEPRGPIFMSNNYSRRTHCRAVVPDASEPSPTRRTALGNLVATASAALLALPSLAAENNIAISTDSALSSSNSVYTDALDGFSLTVPAGWQLGTGDALGGAASSDPKARFSNAAGLQRVVAFIPPSTSDVNLAITVRTPSADFTSLGSFGTAQQWAESLISAMDRSYMLKKTAPQNGRGAVSSGGEAVPIAKLVDVKDKNGQYIVRYTVSREGSPTRVVISAVALGVSPRSGVRRFYTINGSCTTETEGKFGEILQTAVASFTAPSSV